MLGEFQQGDARSGEIELRSFAEGAPSVVLLRQLEDDAWYVIGVTTDSIRLTTPAIGDTLASPQPLEGQAYAYEGNVLVRLFADGVQEPIGQTNVTGRGDGVLGDFTGELEFTQRHRRHPRRARAERHQRRGRLAGRALGDPGAPLAKPRVGAAPRPP